MGYNKRTLTAFFLLASIIGVHQVSFAQISAAYEVPADQTFAWTELTFKASSFLKSLKLKIQIDPANPMSADFFEETKTDLSDCAKEDNDCRLMRVHFSLRGLGGYQRQYEENIWFNGPLSSPVARIRLSSGNDLWIKSYSWENEGIRRQKIVPGSSEENDIPPTGWTSRSESFYAYPESASQCSVISDPSLIVYILSALKSGRNSDSFQVCVFGRKQLHRVTIKEGQSAPLDVRYKTRSPSQEATVEAEIVPTVFFVSAETLALDESEPEDFLFLGLHKDIRIYMDMEKRLPVRISGENKTIGQLVLDLRIQSGRAAAD